ncbi:vascular endothelial growth factor receptor 2 [Megalops cyprinoides]|uniref:vascular endothelial growth factor receptor 2 n=1 Tax=Megalops cyprinoides TaxID=118141 RepID=UPI001864DD2A|nr:vascular endothelial growth factor receptor 2 [Megalops cyprinoides]
MSCGSAFSCGRKMTLVLVIFLLGLLRRTSVMGIELKFIPDPPRLNIPGSVHKINVSDALELRCSGRQHVEWKTPYNRSYAEGRLALADCSGSGLFCTFLVLTKATANETGEYRCSYRDLPAEDGKTSVAVYVFVQDYKVPFVRSSQNYDVVFIREGQQVVIPCLVSVEDLNVTLYTKYPKKELTPNGREVVWDSRKGFTVPSHLISYAGVVFCQTRIHNDTFQSSLYIVAVVGYKIYDLTLSPSQQRLAVGERLLLNCTAHTELNVGLEFQWTCPQGKVLANGSETRSHKKKLWDSLELSSTLTVENVTVNDTGEYTCLASSGKMSRTARASLVVYEKPFILLNGVWPQTVETTVSDRVLKVPVKYLAYPQPELKWYKNGQPLSREELKYRVRVGRDMITIHDIAEKDAGNYTVVLRNPTTKEEQQRSFQLLVNVPPQILEKEVAQDSDVHMYGSSPTLRCTARGLPSPVHIQWQWMPREDCPFSFLSAGWKSGMSQKECSKWRDIANNTGKNPVDSLTTDTDRSHKTVSSLKIQRAEVHALYRCVASNKVGHDERVIFFHVTRGLELSVWPSREPLVQDSVVLKCKADQLIYTNLHWFWVGTNVTNPAQYPPVQPCRALTLPKQPLPQAVLSGLQGPNLTLELPLTNVSHRDQGLYVCQVENIKTHERTCLLHNLALRALQVSKILANLTDQRVNVSDTTSFVCEVTGTPAPTVLWIKNNKTLAEGSGVVLSKGNRTLTIQRVKKEDNGRYTCLACNSQGCDYSSASLSVEGAEEKTNVELIVPIGAVVIAMFFWLLIVFVIRSRKRPTRGELKTGYLSIIVDSEDLPMDEHCERLTYDSSKWEFPRDRLKLGEPLGRGAFGQVVEAAAFGIEKAATCTTVAVKMLKEGATSSEYRALMSELKILIHIGHHLNVVNLLGACTKPGGPLMVIVEYCKYGNLSSYLKSQRGSYSPFKRKPLQSWKDSPQVKEDLSEGDLGLGTSAHLDTYRGGSCFLEDPSEAHLQLQGSDTTEKSHLTMEDLISYSFQVARGMEFLSSRKCIHRDLAARNILLSENNVVKICDFGLARDIYKDPDYVRKGDARLPLKWMAPETIFDRVYTTQSDVWSFGVLLWEIFSLGASPYPGVAIDEAFCRRLKEGTRMRAPEYASAEIYQTMLDCWLDRPTDRPTFSELVEHLGNLLQASAQQGGKDYIPVTEVQLEAVSEASYSCKPLEDGTDVQFHYDNAPTLRFTPHSERCRGVVTAKVLEDIMAEHSVVMDGQADSRMDFSPEEMKNLNPQLSQTPTFSPLLRSKSRESLASESSNQTSGYQSGYHSDDTDTPIYANEEMILKKSVMMKAPLKTSQKYGVEVRYSAPPV